LLWRRRDPFKIVMTYKTFVEQTAMSDKLDDPVKDRGYHC
jgi:hypothetical protein